MIFGSGCSGIEAASQAWTPLGWKATWFSEIEPFPCSVLAHHYPDVPNLGDMTALEEHEFVHSHPLDLLVAGTPCQGFSVAGLRKGLADDRSNLALSYVRLALRKQPRWLLWENVPGAFTTNKGQDFGCFLSGLSGVDVSVPEGGWKSSGILVGASGHYGLAWRVLDAQYAGVPQRRRRIFLVGYLGDWRCAAAVLFERESLHGNPPPSSQTRQDLTYDVAPCLAASGRGFERPGDSRGQDCLVASTGETSHCLNAGGMGRQDYETETLIAHSLRADGFDASEDGTGRGTPLVPVVAGTLRAYSGRNQVESTYLAFSCKDSGGDAGELAPTLRAGGHSESHANAGVMPAIAYSVCLGSDPIHSEELAMPQTTRNGDPGVVAYAIQERAICENPEAGPDGVGVRSDNKAYTLEARTVPQAVATTMAVRRLTPRECERLQGFPDDYTAVPHRGRSAADGPRYKALGNSMAVPCMRWIGERIQLVDDTLAALQQENQ